MSKPFTLAVMTSGGDSPGMNPAVRAVVRMALSQECAVKGVQRGYLGLIEGLFTDMDTHSVARILDRGGTVLGTSRCPAFLTPEGRDQAISMIKQAGIDGLVVIGGNGSLAGARELHNRGIHVVGLPASIDNDLIGTDMAIGVDTCLNTIMHALDNIRDTAISHNRAFVIEVMGRNCGYLALMSALISGAGIVILPEKAPTLAEVGEEIMRAQKAAKSHFIIVVAEGANLKADAIATYLRTHPAFQFETRVTILGHVQRGGTPSAFDRNLATRLGVAAVTALLSGRSGCMLGMREGHIHETPLSEVIDGIRMPDTDLYEYVQILNR